jgi:NADH-quinone oxidoreductase subunit G
VIAITTYATTGMRGFAEVILPLAPTAESEGSMVNFDGDTIHFTAAAKPVGEARPGWKILRRLGEALQLEGFAQTSLAQLQEEMQAAIGQGGLSAAEPDLQPLVYADDLYRIGEVPVYSVDAQCRRAAPLQATALADSDFVGLNAADAGRLGLDDGAKARVSQGEKSTELAVRVTSRVPEGGAWVRSATCATHMLGHAFAPIKVEVA